MSDYRVSADAEITDVDLDQDPLVLSDGTVLNEDAAGQYGREVADRAARRRSGRPSLSGETMTRSPRVSARISAQTYLRLQQRAAAESRPLSAVIREALDQYV